MRLVAGVKGLGKKLREWKKKSLNIYWQPCHGVGLCPEAGWREGRTARRVHVETDGTALYVEVVIPL